MKVPNFSSASEAEVRGSSGRVVVIEDLSFRSSAWASAGGGGGLIGGAAAYRPPGERGDGQGAEREQHETDGVTAGGAVGGAHHQGREEPAQAAGCADDPGDRADRGGRCDPGDQREGRPGS